MNEPNGPSASPVGIRTAGMLLVAALALATPEISSCSSLARSAALEPARAVTVEEIDAALARIGVHRRLLMIGAHPDDEHNALLAWVSNGEAGEAAYLSLSRGEGGQNLIGSELGVGLGLIRSGELLAARRVERTRQFFASGFDFGYTRSLDETLERWPEAVLLEDVQRVVERFKPQVIVSIFPDDGRGGHGQHQASGKIAHRLFDPEVMSTMQWHPQTLVRGSWWSPEEADLEIELRGIDPYTGRSIQQTAARSRSLHRSQDMGRLEEMGPATLRLTRVFGPSGRADELFGGVDTSLGAVADLLPESSDREALRGRLDGIAALADATRKWVSPAQLFAAAASTGQLLNDLLAARASIDSDSSAGAATVRLLLDEKIDLAEVAYLGAARLFFDATVENPRLTEGDSTEITVSVWNPGAQHVELQEIRVVAPDGWAVAPESVVLKAAASGHEGHAAHAGGHGDAASGGLSGADPRAGHGEHSGDVLSWTFTVDLPVGAAQPAYFLRRERRGDLYDWTAVGEELRGEPFEPAPLHAHYSMTINGVPVEFEREVVSRVGDQARGEVRRPLEIVPPIELKVEPSLLLWRLDQELPSVSVRVRSNRAHPVRGLVQLETVDGWRLEAAEVAIEEAYGETRLELQLTTDEMTAGLYDLQLAFEGDDGEIADRWFEPLEYPHIRSRVVVETAHLQVSAFELQLPVTERIGYVRGASDRVPEALERIGVPVELLTAEDLRSGDLDRFATIVIGSRAYEVNRALVESNDRLLAFARAGGLLLVQYQQYAFVRGEYAPYSLQIARPHDRITDETSPVRFLDPPHTVLTQPNRITERDFESWVTERGLYFASEWDETRYTSVLAMRDPGQSDKLGGLLVAPLGEGTYVYTGLSFFRELPAGVPGAFRLFANLLALHDVKPSARAGR